MVATPDSPDGSSNLVADRDERLLVAPAAEQKISARRDRRFLTTLVAVSLLVHGCLMLALLFFERAPDEVRQSGEIPIEVTIEPPPSGKSAAPQGGSPEKAASPLAAEKRDPGQKPIGASAPEPERKSAVEPKPSERAAAAASEKAAPPAAAARKDAARKSASAEKRSIKPASRGVADNKGAGDDHLKPAEAGLQLPFDLGPQIFRAVATPLPVDGGDDPTNYKVIVFGMLERAKHFPEAAAERRASGVAVIGFTLDEAGQVLGVSLLRSSGDVDLDAESVGVVTRAAPYPAPPPGAPRSFAAEITFGAQQ